MYVIYNPTSWLVDSWAPSQAKADIQAAKGTTLSAYQGETVRPRWAQPKNCYFNASTNTYQHDRIIPPTGVAIVQFAALQVHRAYYGEVYPRIERYGWTFPYNLKADVEDVLLGAKKAFYLRMRDGRIPVAQRVAYAQNIFFGPSEITGHGTPTATIKLFSAVDSVRIPSNPRGRPMEWLRWDADAGAYIRQSMANAVRTASTDFPSSGLPNFMEIDLLSEHGLVVLFLRSRYGL